MYEIQHYSQRVANTLHSNWVTINKNNSILKEINILLFLLLLNLYENPKLRLNLIQHLVNKWHDRNNT